MSDVKPYVDPNGPEYYAPPELRERATREPPGVTPEPAAEWRPRLSEGPPLQPLDKPQRRDEVFTKAVAQALQEAMEPGPVEAPSVLRGTLGQRALFSLVVRFSIAVAIAASTALVLVMAIPASQSPTVQSPAVQSNDTASFSSFWQSVKSSVLPAPPSKRIATLTVQDGSGLANDALPLGVSVRAPPSPAVMTAAAPPVASVAPSPPPPAEIVRNLDPKEILGLVKRGQDLLASGDIQSARLLLLRGAEAQDARAALLLGTTWDPNLLKQLGANGPLADIAQARHWYQKAKEWGEPDAQRQLDALALIR